MPLSNMLSNRLDNLIDSSNKEDIISCCQNRNTTSPELLAIRRNKITDHFEIKEKATKKNRVISYFEIKK